MLQVVGILMMMSSCCVCTWPMVIPAQFDKDVQTPVPNLTEMFKQSDKAGFAITVLSTIIGGLAMAVFGLGLQADKPRAAWAAVIVSGLLLLCLLGGGLAIWMGNGSWPTRLWNLVLILIAIISVGFCIKSLQQILRDPPPADMDILPPDFEIPKSWH
jgi:hypothetical protein